MPSSTDSDTVTRNIRVSVSPKYEPDHSEPGEQRYIFSYDVTIQNESDRTVTLISRHWIIINDHGDRQEVKGPGVVGFTPTLAPGESFRYSSYCPLDSSFGTMEGFYKMKAEENEEFDVVIGRFYLVADQPV